MFSSTKVAEDNKIESLFPDEEEGGTRKLGSVINKIFHMTAYAYHSDQSILKITLATKNIFTLPSFSLKKGST